MVARTANNKRCLIILLKQRDKLSDREVAEQVKDVSYATVNRIYNDYLNGKDVMLPRRRSGRPRKMTKPESHWASLLLERGLAKTAVELQREFFPNLSVDTVRRRLRDLSYRSYKRRKVPFLSSKKRTRRLKWARLHATWSLEDWAKVAFSDESKFLIFNANGPVYYWKKQGGPMKDSYTKPMIKYGAGSVMVWGCILHDRVGQLHLIEDTMTAAVYTQILSHAYLGTIRSIRRRVSSIIFQHDNDPKHTAKVTTKWPLDHKIPVLPWPSSSPDMNPIEHVWAYLDRQVRLRSVLPTSRDGLWRALHEEWQKIPPSFIAKLYRSMPRRIAAVIKAKGGHTRY
ncbi:hypothetical protein RSOLAG1IB_12359 [Rhizoctonia solani AG-1 IB]|uniref:Transposase n=1 Tax=Thanatephorus cucumeris (strain AG1-IB / isolate 7/3/14) TaxID=1108050 RepID=A0A0B7FUA9_THACB|nr:hypothetical protein RSOLAG1IB_12359 [Rhizoctonia solani AG-1 IB]